MEQLLLTLLAMAGVYVKGRWDGDRAAREDIASRINKGKK